MLAQDPGLVVLSEAGAVSPYRNRVARSRAQDEIKAVANVVARIPNEGSLSTIRLLQSTPRPRKGRVSDRN